MVLDTEGSKKQFVLLVGKGTEGWNCRSLVACALYRRPQSSIFVLQSSTRCLRSIDDNSTTATIFLSDDNYKILEEELELTKQYPFKINVMQNMNDLVVYKKDVVAGRLGFHINPYNFDSRDERDLFKQLREVLDEDEAIVDIYFTGGVADEVHNDFYFEYYSPQLKRVARYFPDLLLETTKGRFLVVEVKTNQERLNYEQNKKTYKGKRNELFNEVFAKEMGFREFQEVNKNFEYHIIFDAGLQQQQKELYQAVQAIN